MSQALRWRAAGFAAATLMLLSACQETSSVGDRTAAAEARRAGDCGAAVDFLLAVTQNYLDGLAETTATGPAASPSPPTDRPTAQQAAQEQFATALQDIRGYAASRGCDPRGFQASLAQGLGSLSAGGPVARAVLLQLQADTDAGPRPRPGPLQPGDDVAAAVAAAKSGATVQLAAGSFELTETLALLRGVTLRGAGRGSTVLQSAAAGGPVLVLTDEPVVLRDVSVRRTGEAPGPVLSVAPVATVELTGVRITGARADAEGLGGVGILMSGGSGGQKGPTRRVSLRVTDSEIFDNAVAGIVVAGEHRAEVTRTAVERSGQCGVCYLGTSDGVVRDSRFTDNAAGIVAGDDARPRIETSDLTGGQVGIQAIDRAAPVVTGTTVTRPARAAFVWTGAAAGRLDGNRCVEVPFGIVAGPATAPLLGENDCQVARGEQ